MQKRLAVALLIVGVATGLAASQQAPATPPATGLIIGRVVDAQTNAPVPGVLVSILLMKGTLANTQPTAEPRMTTDAQGRFLFRALPAGDYMIVASVGGSNTFSPSGFIVTGNGFPAGAYLSGGFGQRRPSGPLRNLELTDNQKVGDVVIRLWKAGAISGRVLDEAGEPLVNQVVGVAQLSPGGRLLTGPTVRTDDRGAYRLSSLMPGAYIVVVPQTQVSMPLSIGEELAAGPDPMAAQRFSQANAPSPRISGVRVGSSVLSTTPDIVRYSAEALISNALPPVREGDALFVYPTTFFPGATRLTQSARVVLQSGEDKSNTDIQLRPARAASISGVVTDEAGAVPNMGLHLMPADMGPDGAVLEAATTVSDSRGAFTFPAVPAGQYTVLAWRIGGVPTGNPQQPLAIAARAGEMPGAWARQTVTVGARPIDNVTVTMHAPINVTGQVVFEGASDRPTAERFRNGPLVTMFPVDPLSRTPGPSSGSLIDIGNNGRIQIKGVAPPGRFLLGVPTIPAPWTFQSVTLAGRDVTDAAIDVVDADISDLVITYTDRPASISGTVAIVQGGERDIAVFLFPSNTARWPDSRSLSRTFRAVRVSSKGAFTMPNVLPGEYQIVAVADASAGDWPDEQFLTKIAAGAGLLRVSANQAATVTLNVSVIK